MTAWDAATYRARVADPDRRIRHEAGSPDPAEVAAYVRAVGGRAAPGRTVVVLGATPELRNGFAATGAGVAAIDESGDAWALYGDWGPSDEVRIEGRWQDVRDLVEGPVHAVVGDGIVGNLPDLAAARHLLEVLADLVGSGGVIVLRQALVPGDLDRSAVTPDRLLRDHRAGYLDDAEFGFAVRLLGHLDTCWDAETGILDGRALTECTERWADAVGLHPTERAAIGRYTYRGPNLIPAESTWRELVASIGLARTVVGPTGRYWYRSYPVEVLVPEQARRTAPGGRPGPEGSGPAPR